MTQTLLTIFVPTLTVLVGILINQRGITHLHGQISELNVRLSQAEGRIDSRMTSLEGRIDSRMTALENRFHADMMMVIGKLTELEVRVAKLETQRQ